MPTAFVPSFQPFDATTPCSGIHGLYVSQGHHTKFVPATLTDVPNIITELTRSSDVPIFTSDLCLLLATMLWHRDPNTPKLISLIDKRHVISIEDLVTVLALSNEMKDRYRLDDAETITRQGPSLLRTANNRLPATNPRTHPGGVNLETLGNAGAICATWQGARIDADLLAWLVAQHPGTDWSQIRRNIHADGRVHPIYTRSVFSRLHSRAPNVQNMTLRPGVIDTPPRELIVADPGTVLVGLDIRSAELEALFATWTQWFPGDPRVDRLNDPNAAIDHHQTTGDELNTILPLATNTRREIGKAVNFCLINGGGLPGLNAILAAADMTERLDKHKLHRIFACINERLPMDRWYAVGEEHASREQTTTITGRTYPIAHRGQFSSAHLQSVVADTVAVSILELAARWKPPAVMVYDEVVLPATSAEQGATLAEAFCRAGRRLVPQWDLKVRTTIYPHDWGHPLDHRPILTRLY